MLNFKSLVSVALLGVAATSSPLHAQTSAPAPAATPAVAVPGPALAPPTVAVVDVRRVIQESLAGKSIQSQLETEGRKFRDQVTHMDDELKTAENEIRRSRGVATPDAQNEQMQGYQRKQAEFQRIAQERRDALTKAQNDAFNVVSDNIRDIVQQLAGERRIGLVMQKEAVLALSDKNMDVTDDVIQRLNAKLPTVAVTVAAAAPGATATGPAATTPASQPPAAAKKK